MPAPNSLQQLSAALVAAVEQAASYTVSVHARRVPSSGVIWADGVIVAADHTIERDEDISVRLPDGRLVPSTLAGRDPLSDLAALRCGGAVGAARRADEPRVGEVALAVGRGSAGIRASFGVIGAIGGPWATRGGAVERAYLIDATLYPGFSGGPLVAADGALLGVSSGGQGGQGIAIPVNVVEPVVAQLLAHGRLKRAYLGAATQPARLPSALAAGAGQASGLLIVGLAPGSPAEHGGALIGDILLAIDGQLLRDTDELRAALTPERIDRPATLRVLRGGVPCDLVIVIGESRGHRGRR